MARPHKFTIDVVTAILQNVAAGLSFKIAAEDAGVSYDTFNDWKHGRFPRSTKDNPIDPELKVQFAEGLTRARAAGIKGHHTHIAVAGKTDWRASAWLLERIEPDTYAKNRLELTGKDGGPIELTDVVDTRIAKIAERFGITEDAVRAKLAGAKAPRDDE